MSAGPVADDGELELFLIVDPAQMRDGIAALALEGEIGPLRRIGLNEGVAQERTGADDGEGDLGAGSERVDEEVLVGVVGKAAERAEPAGSGQVATHAQPRVAEAEQRANVVQVLREADRYAREALLPLNAAGDRAGCRLERPADAKHENGTNPATEEIEGTTGREVPASFWQRYLQSQRQPHTPGVWVVYFSLAALPIGRILTPEDLVPALDYLVGDGSSAMCAGVLTVDGGFAL